MDKHPSDHTRHISNTRKKKKQLYSDDSTVDTNKTPDSRSQDDDDQQTHVVIVGAGMAGLVCARTLLEENDQVRVTLAEASTQPGGRIQVDREFCPGYALDTGAEYIHSTGTILTDYIEEFRERGLLPTTARSKAAPLTTIGDKLDQLGKKKTSDESLADESVVVFDKQLHENKNRSSDDSTHHALDNDSTHHALDNDSTHHALDNDSTHHALDNDSTNHTLDNDSTNHALDIDSTNHALDNDSTQHLLDSDSTQHLAMDTTLGSTMPEEHLGSSKMDPDFYEEIFITAHADGGPSPHKTRDGKFGMYYVGGELRMFNDPYTLPLDQALEGMMDHDCQDPEMSIHQALTNAAENSGLQESLSAPLYHLGLAGYGNTATCTDLQDLSLHILQRYERHWEHAEVHGDYRIPSELGLYSVVQALVDVLQHEHADRFTLLLNSPVTDIQPLQEQCNVPTQHHMSVTIQEDSTQSVQRILGADYVVVAVPPPMIPKILPDLLPPEKVEALEHVGFTNIVKVICKFSEPFWPEELQSIVSAEGLFPELWFRSNFGPDQNLVVFYLSDDYAQEFINEVRLDLTDHNTSSEPWDKPACAELCIQHVAAVLGLSEEDLRSIFVDVLIHDWKHDEEWIGGGHSHPRIGMTVRHLEALAAPICEDRVHFCGEATNTNAACTVQSAMETGVRAAREVVASSQGRKVHEERSPKRQDKMDSTAKSHQHTKTNAPTLSKDLQTENTKVVELIKEQMSVSRSLAQQEQSSFAAIETMEQKQMEMSRVLLKQEETSMRMIQALEQMQEERDLAKQKVQEARQEADGALGERNDLAFKYQQQNQALEMLQFQVQSLTDALEEKDAMVRDRDEELKVQAQRALMLSQDLQEEKSRAESQIKSQEAMIKSRDAIIKIMAQKQKSAASRAEEALSRAEAARAMVRDRDAVIRIMAQRVQALTQQNKEALESRAEAKSSSPQARSSTRASWKREQSLRQEKVAREEKLKLLMNRVRSNSTKGERPGASTRTNTSVAARPSVTKSYSKGGSSGNSGTPISRASAASESTFSTVSMHTDASSVISDS